METTCFNFTAWPHCCHCFENGGFEVSINNYGKIFAPSSATSDTVWLIHPHRTFDVYWPVRKMQVANNVYHIPPPPNLSTLTALYAAFTVFIYNTNAPFCQQNIFGNGTCGDPE